MYILLIFFSNSPDVAMRSSGRHCNGMTTFFSAVRVFLEAIVPPNLASSAEDVCATHSVLFYTARDVQSKMVGEISVLGLLCLHRAAITRCGI